MENGKNSIPIGREVVGKDVNLPLKHRAHWFSPNGDVDLKAIDFRWTIDHSDREPRLGQLLKPINQSLHLFLGWLRSIRGRR
jgi:hypothetical protein